MANSKALSSLVIPTTTLVVLLLFSTAEAAVKGGYWYYDSRLDASKIDSTHFTHLFCAFAGLDSTTNQITLPSSAFSTFAQTVKQNNPSVKTLLSIGGGGRSSNFSAMASESGSRKIFIDSSIQVARANNFDGLDLDWEYPSKDTENTNLGLLLSEWRTAVAKEATDSGEPALLLSAAVAGSDQISELKYYPGRSIAENLDWVNVMVYDLFVPDMNPDSTRPPAPLFNPGGPFSGDEGVMAWINVVGVPASKLAIGLPFYGYAWNLVDGNKNGLFAPANGGASGGEVMNYGEIREFITNQGATQVYNSTFVTDYAYSGTTWVGYDDNQTVTTKVTYAKQNQMFGYFAWQIAMDDNWTLSKAASDAWGS